ncbi:hypothetical protein NDI54_05925 [Haloarcula sp. S1AR25-5A]|uniref:DUF8136 domain-containing protein n=1 Tax=Haloarcula terrestris TaxID=2950533 RepID=A0AAE4EX59_9EURY|nr:hypothetical protein [Haloarcula terrestris]MDS0220892.1 hypothetical protein [Haloarcula terrestris]
MTEDASAHAREEDDAGSYDDLLATLDMLETEALRKVENGRVYDAENERVRIKWIRIAKDVIAEKRKVMADRDLQELTERIEQLEERADGDGVAPSGVRS